MSGAVGFWLAADALTSFSAVPLRISTLAGALTSAAAGAYGLYVIVMRLLPRPPEPDDDARPATGDDVPPPP